MSLHRQTVAMKSSPPTPTAKNGDNDYDELYDEEYDSDHVDPNVFSIRHPLNPPSAKILSTEALHSLIHEGLIDLNPPYQRDVVWSEPKQIALIDSIFRNFYIPPVVFAVKLDDDGEQVRICVDGKQRLTSIQKFFDGQIPHRDIVTGKRFWYTRPENLKASRLEVPEAYKQMFKEKQITCVDYEDLTPETERDIFQRVQLGMPLTAAEKLQAISSPWAEWISELESRHVAVEGGLSHVLEWDTRRGRDFQNIAHMIYCCDGIEDEPLPTAQKLDKWLSRVDSPGEQIKQDIEGVLKQFWTIAVNPKLNYGLKKIGKRVAPVEFVFIGVLLYVLRKESIEDQAHAIHNLRTAVREQHDDIRNNGKVGKSMWDFIRTIRVNPTGPLIFRSSGGPVNQDFKKRKRKAGDEDEEYRPQPIKSLSKPVKTRATKQAKM